MTHDGVSLIAARDRCGNNGPSCRRTDCPWPEGRCVELAALPARDDERRDAILTAFEQGVVDNFDALAAEHKLDEDEAHRLISRISESLYTTAQALYA